MSAVSEIEIKINELKAEIKPLKEQFESAIKARPHYDFHHWEKLYGNLDNQFLPMEEELKNLEFLRLFALAKMGNTETSIPETSIPETSIPETSIPENNTLRNLLLIGGILVLI